MYETKRNSAFVKQAAILAAASLISRFLGFLYRVPMTRMIGDFGNAVYSGGYNIYNFLLILSSAGIPAAVGKMVSERVALGQYRNAHRVFRVALFITGSLGFIGMIALIVGAEWISSSVLKIPETYYTILTLAPTVFIVAIMAVFRGYFQGMNTMVPTAVSQVVEQIFNAVFSVYLAYLFINVNIFGETGNVAYGAAGGTAGTGIGAAAGLAVIFISYNLFKDRIYRKMILEGDVFEPEDKKYIASVLIHTAVPIIIGTAIFSITNIADTSMAMSRLMASGAFTAEEAKILYGQLGGKYVVLTTLPVSVSTAIATAAVPNIAASVATKDIRSVKNKLNLILKIAMVISIPAAVGMGVLGDQILILLYGSQSSGGILLKVGALSIIFLALSQVVTGLLQGIGRVKVPVFSAAVGAAAKLVLNYFLISIPVINVLGAVISTTVCYMLASGINLYMLAKITKVKPNLADSLFKPGFASVLMGVLCYFSYKGMFVISKSNSISSIIAILLGMAFYFIVLYRIKGITKKDLGYIPGGQKIISLFKL